MAASVFVHAIAAFGAAQENPAQGMQKGPSQAGQQGGQQITQQDVAPIQTATDLMNRCGGIVQALGQMKAPPNHADAKMQEFHNQNIFKKAPSHAGEVAKKHDPQHENFMRAMQKGKADLEQCAAQLGPWMKPMPQHLQKLHEMMLNAGKPGAISQDTAKRLHQVITQYDNTHEKFVEVVTTLSNDQHVQSYLHEAIVKLVDAATPPNNFTKH